MNKWGEIMSRSFNNKIRKLKIEAKKAFSRVKGNPFRERSTELVLFIYITALGRLYAGEIPELAGITEFKGFDAKDISKALFKLPLSERNIISDKFDNDDLSDEDLTKIIEFLVQEEVVH